MCSDHLVSVFKYTKFHPNSSNSFSMKNIHAILTNKHSNLYIVKVYPITILGFILVPCQIPYSYRISEHEYRILKKNFCLINCKKKKSLRHIIQNRFLNSATNRKIHLGKVTNMGTASSKVNANNNKQKIYIFKDTLGSVCSDSIYLVAGSSSTWGIYLCDEHVCL